MQTGAGEAGQAPAAGAAEQAGQADPSAPAEQQAGTPANPTPSSTPPVLADGTNPAEILGEDGKPVWFDRAYVESLRTESASRRVAAKDAATELDTYKTTVGKALGFVPDEAPVEEQLSSITGERDNLQSELTAARQENALLRATQKVTGADYDVLSDSRKFGQELDQIDATAADYASQVEALVTRYATTEARFQGTPRTPSSGSSHNPNPDGGDDFEASRKRAAALIDGGGF